jgi:hypothetical protein
MIVEVNLLGMDNDSIGKVWIQIPITTKKNKKLNVRNS